jgi:chromatin structure-remodeling complex subunit RSC1/2
MRATKRKAEEAGVADREEAAKKAKSDKEQKFKQAVSDLGTKALKALEDQLAAATKMELEASFDGNADVGLARVLDRLTQEQKLAEIKKIQRELSAIEREEAKRTTVTGMTARLEEKI